MSLPLSVSVSHRIGTQPTIGALLPNIRSRNSHQHRPRFIRVRSAYEDIEQEDGSSGSDGDVVKAEQEPQPTSKKAGKKDNEEETNKVKDITKCTTVELGQIHVELKEDDVAYQHLKTYCRQLQLGGKDTKDNMRAKLLKVLRDHLGHMCLWDGKVVDFRAFKPPNTMTEAELDLFFNKVDVMRPDSRSAKEELAFAILVAYGAMLATEVPVGQNDYKNKTVEELKTLCHERNLKSQGKRDELESRLTNWDRQVKEAEAARKAELEFKKELQKANINRPPRPPSRQLEVELGDAQEELAHAREMELPELRLALLRREMPVYGTKDVLVDRITEILYRDVVEAFGGSVRLMQYAQAAVMKLSQTEVDKELEYRGLASDFTVQEEAALRLRNVLVDEWVFQALNPIPPQEASVGSDGESSEADNAQQHAHVEDDSHDDGYNTSALSIGLVCGGFTLSQRQQALSSARTALSRLQTDELWGTVPPLQPGLNFFDDENAQPASAPPTEPARFALDPILGPNGLTVQLVDTGMEDDGFLMNSYAVVATPVEGRGVGTKELTFISSVSTVPLNGLQPDTVYQLTAHYSNSAGLGPAGEPLQVGTSVYTGGACWVYYPYETVLGNGDWRFVKLSWKEVYGCSAAELDARLAMPGGALEAYSLEEIKSQHDLMLPQGVLPSSDNELATDRVKFTDKLESLGYASLKLMTVTREDVGNSDELGNRITEWLASQGLDVDVARVAVRAEVGGDVVVAGIGKGLEQLLPGALEIMQENNIHNVVLQPVVPGSVFVSCSVIETPAGPVALPPTEIDTYDLEVDFIRENLKFQKFLAVKEGMDAAAVDALSAMMYEDLQTHPEVVGASGVGAGPSQELRCSTPPASLDVETCQSVRNAAVKLFQDLGLSSYAQFSGWVIPQDPYGATGLQEAVDVFTKLRQIEAASSSSNELVESNGASKKPASKFSELLAVDQAEREERKDRLQDLTTVATSAAIEAQASEEAAAVSQAIGLADAEGIGPYGVEYGKFASIPLDDSTRQDLLASFLPGHVPSIPTALPVLREVTSLAATTVAAVDAHQLTNLDTGYFVIFDKLSLSPDFSQLGGPLGQQAAVSGLGLSDVVDLIAASAAAKAGVTDSYTNVPSHVDPVHDVAWRPGMATHSFGSDLGSAFDSPFITQEGRPTLEDIGKAVKEWQSPNRIPEPIGYDDIISDSDENAPPVVEESATSEQGTYAELNATSTVQTVAPEFAQDARPGAIGSNMVEYSLEEEDDPTAVLSRKFPGLHPTKQRVWVLLGGEGPERDQGLTSALNAIALLSAQKDLHVEAFMLEPPNCGVKSEESRRTLLSRRTELLTIGATDDELLADFTEYHPSRIKHPSTAPAGELEWRGLWCLGSCSVLAPSVADLHHNCETALTNYNTSRWTREDGDALHGQEQVVHTVKKELELAGVQVGQSTGPWGGSSLKDGGQPPEFCFFDAWADAAAKQCAVVLLALPSHPSAQGAIQAALERKAVPYTGSSSVTTELCVERAEFLKRLSDIAYPGSGISTPPFHTVSLLELAAKCDTEASADEFVSRLSDHWGLTDFSKPLVIRPARDAAGRGIARIANGTDLQNYTYAVQAWEDTIPAGCLMLESSDIEMVFPPPAAFVLEPCPEVLAPEVVVDVAHAPSAAYTAPGAGLGVGVDGVAGTEGSVLYNALKSPQSWLRVTACVLGSVTRMQCLGLTAEVTCTTIDPSGYETQSILQLTPPPPSVLSSRIAAKAGAQIHQVANQLGITGAAEMTAMVNSSSGELVVLDVNLMPDLTPNGILMRQAAVIEGSDPMSSTDVLRELLKIGMSRGEDGSYQTMLPYSDDFAKGIEDMLAVKPPPPPSVEGMGAPYEVSVEDDGQVVVEE